MSGPTRSHQETYWQALATTPIVQIVQGRFKKKRIECKHPACPNPRRRFFKKLEEKRTDVSIGLCMLDDAYQNACDRLILISADSDLVPAVELVKHRFPEKRLIVYMPLGADGDRDSDRAHHNYELRSSADHASVLPWKLITISQFPEVIITAAGDHVERPTKWGIQPVKPEPVDLAIKPGCCDWCGRDLAVAEAVGDQVVVGGEL